MKKSLVLILLLIGFTSISKAQFDTSEYKPVVNPLTTKYESLTNKLAIPAVGVNKLNAQIVYDISPKTNNDSLRVYNISGRDTITFRDTLTSSKSFATYNLGSQYTYITIAITRGDTNKTNMDSIKTYSLSTYGDTAQTGLRNLLTFTDGQVGIAGSSANSVVGYATQKYMLLDPICKFLHIRAVNAVLTGRIYILTIRAVKQ